jgi:hypothetical protein
MLIAGQMLSIPHDPPAALAQAVGSHGNSAPLPSGATAVKKALLAAYVLADETMPLKW